MIELVLTVALVIAFIRIVDLERDRDATVTELNRHLTSLNKRISSLEEKS